MKSILTSIIMGAFFCFPSWCLESDESIAHFKPEGRWMGDLHPFFREGEWQVFCFTTPAEPLRAHLYRMESSRFVSDDLVHWHEKPLEHSDPQKAWWTEGIVEKDGQVFSFYSCLWGNEGINLALSSDGTHWDDYEDNPIIPASHLRLPHVRSPFIYYDKTESEYWMVLSVVTESAGERPGWVPHNYAGAYYYCTSKDLMNWSPLKELYAPENINIPECPELFPLDGRYYLLGSPFLGDTVGQGVYRVADSPTGPWTQARTETIDGVNVLAPNTGTDGKRRLFFGWIPTYENNQDNGALQWGGHLAFPRELHAAKDGTLLARLPEDFIALRGDPFVLTPSKSWGAAATASSAHIQLPAGSDFGEVQFDGAGSHFELRAMLEFGPDCPEAGVVVKAGDREDFAGYEVAVDLARQKLVLRRHLDRRREIVSQDISLRPGKPVEIRVFVDGTIIEAFLDGRFCLAGRAHQQPAAQRVGFYSKYGAFEARDIQVFQLKDVRTGKEANPVDLAPTPAQGTAAPGNALLLPRMTAHCYTPFVPSLNPQDGLTLECWAKPTEGTSGATRDLIIKGDGPGSEMHYGLSITRGNALEFFFRTETGSIIRCTSPYHMIEDGKWVHLAAVLDPGKKEIRLYRNAELLAVKPSISGNLDINDSSALRLGFPSGSQRFTPFLGLIDEVRLWSVPRSAKQISNALHGLPEPLTADALVLCWTFDEEQKGSEVQNYATYYPNLAPALHAGQAWPFDGARLFNENAPR